MRLGFSVAAFLEPDILLVDEVLAVGDASFQQKCLDRMRYVLSQGTTLVYVSHDLATVEATCARGMWLEDGAVKAEGAVGDVLDAYRRFFDDVDEFPHPESSVVRLLKAEASGAIATPIRSGGNLDLRFAFESSEARIGARRDRCHAIVGPSDVLRRSAGRTRSGGDVGPLPHLPSASASRTFHALGGGRGGREARSAPVASSCLVPGRGAAAGSAAARGGPRGPGACGCRLGDQLNARSRTLPSIERG